MGDVRIDEPVLTMLSGLKDRHDRRLAKSAVLGGVGAGVEALRSGTREAVAELARPWDVPKLVEEAVRIPAVAFEDVVVVDVQPDADPMTVTARLGDGARLVLRAVGDDERGEWRPARVVAAGARLPAINPELSYTFPLPDGATGTDDLRWICLALEDVSEALGDRISTMPGRPMTDETEELGQGETRRTRRLAWHVGPNGHLEASVSRHEIFDGATPTWSYFNGMVHGLTDDAACLLNVSIRVNEEPVVRLLLTAPRARLDAAATALAAAAERDPRGPGSRALG